MFTLQFLNNYRFSLYQNYFPFLIRNANCDMTLFSRTYFIYMDELSKISRNTIVSITLRICSFNLKIIPSNNRQMFLLRINFLAKC